MYMWMIRTDGTVVRFIVSNIWRNNRCVLISNHMDRSTIWFIAVFRKRYQLYIKRSTTWPVISTFFYFLRLVHQFIFCLDVYSSHPFFCVCLWSWRCTISVTIFQVSLLAEEYWAVELSLYFSYRHPTLQLFDLFLFMCSLVIFDQCALWKGWRDSRKGQGHVCVRWWEEK